MREGVPLALYGLFAALPAMLATVAAGHMGVHELAVVALAVAVFFTLPQSVGVGSALVFQGALLTRFGELKLLWTEYITTRIKNTNDH